MLLLASCSQDAELDPTNGTGSTDNTESNEGTISFSLGGAAGKVTTRATTAATDDEKKIETLYAVLFRSVASNTATDGTSNTESDNDFFIKAINLTASYSGSSEALTFKAPTDSYQICFIANPGTALATAIGSLKLGESTVKDFKALVAPQAPDHKPMLMTSYFYTAKVTKDGTADLGTVSMERAMARIDVVNKANGITLTGIKFKNRTVKTDLINDGNTKLTTDYLEGTDKEYAVSIKGNSDGSSKYAETIYSYEQYGTEGNAPAMEITYTIDGQTGKTYKHTVTFEKTENDKTTQINLKRNYLYTVNLTNNADKLIVTLTVADWNEGTVFEVSTRKLIIGTDERYRDAALGDIMLSDGTLVKPSAITTEQQAKAIGIVAYLYEDESRIGNGVKNALAANGVTAPCGLVLALKSMCDNDHYVYWEKAVTLGANNYATSLKDLYSKVIDGCEATKLALAINEGNAQESRTTMFANVETFREKYSAPAKTTNWYIPSIGEWIDILGADGIGGADLSSIKNSESVAQSVSGAAAIREKIDEALAKAGEGNFDKIAKEYWSSSEYSGDYAYNVEFGESSSSSLYFAKYYRKTSAWCYARCILAF